MRQRADPDKIKVLMDYHTELKKLFKNGKLDGKIEFFLDQKAAELGISLRTFYRRRV